MPLAAAHAIVGQVRRLIAIGLAIALVPLAATAAGAVPSGRYAIGDSVMLGAKWQLRHRGFIVNAVESRQFSDAVSIVRQKASSGVLPTKVVIHLGTNGILIQSSECDRISKAAGKHRRVYLVTVTGPRRYPGIRKAQNKRLRACAKRRRNTALLDWYGRSRGHGKWFYDGMHLTPSGRDAYASFLGHKTS